MVGGEELKIKDESLLMSSSLRKRKESNKPSSAARMETPDFIET
jgi:hypothetical protein